MFAPMSHNFTGAAFTISAAGVRFKSAILTNQNAAARYFQIWTDAGHTVLAFEVLVPPSYVRDIGQDVLSPYGIQCVGGCYGGWSTTQGSFVSGTDADHVAFVTWGAP